MNPLHPRSVLHTTSYSSGSVWPVPFLLVAGH
uniref:Uncharacterized protein n=1 Tax=Anguilla anguilla TaxID=7936 RepID=A0A0E9TID7_ANGAN